MDDYARAYPSAMDSLMAAPNDARASGNPQAHVEFRGKDFVTSEPPSFHQVTPRYSDAAIPPPSRCWTPSPVASISNGGSNYSYSQAGMFSPHGSQTSFGTAPSVSSSIHLNHGQPSPNPSHRDSRPQSPAKLRSQPSRTGFRAQSPFHHRSQTPISRYQSPVHRIQSPAFGHRPQTPSIGTRVHASLASVARMPQGHIRGNSSTSIEHSLQRALWSQLKPEEQPESEDCAMGDPDGFHISHQAFGENRVTGQAVLDQTDRPAPSPGGGRHEHPAPTSDQEHTRRMMADTRYSAEEHESESSSPADSPDSHTTSSSDPETSSPASSKTDEPRIGQTLRVLRGILHDEYDLRLGISEPPEDMVEAVSSCLCSLSLSLDRQRSLGCVVQLKSVLGDNLAGGAADTLQFTSTDARGASSNEDDSEDDAPDDDPDEDGGGAYVDPNPTGTHKKAKMDQQLACPFRKRNPLRYTCQSLRKRTREEFSWGGLWKTLFPEDREEDIPEPDFEPVVELHEIKSEYDAGQPELLVDLYFGISKLCGTELSDDDRHLASKDPVALHVLGIVDRFMSGVLEKARIQAASAHGLRLH
ncbi:hypothetical protein QBC39DRAFT_332172 [Podospora conica]|nr:hypothetical protein QBC39DRAFT_332172 [Schizothecium conicum]